MYLKRIHYYSGLFITVFIFFHLINHLYSLSGIEMHITYMQQFRKIYRNPLVEFPLLGAVLLQIYAGIRLVKRRSGKPHGFYDRLQVWTGLYLAFFLLIHVIAVMVGRFILQLDTNFYFGAAGINSFPFNLFFIPYYSLAIWCFFGHIAAIHYRKMLERNRYVKWQSFTIICIGTILSVTILYGITGGFKGVDIPSSYNVLIGK